MKPHIPIILSLICGICCASGQLGRPGSGSTPERKPSRVHASWTVFVHPHDQYAVPVPPGVRAIGHPEDLSTANFQSADGSFLMSTWGGAFDQSPTELITAQWNLAVRKGGRDINYQRRGKTWFVVSGTDREGIEYYEKFTMRGRHAAFLNIRFPRSRLRQFEQWVEEIEDGFKLVSLRGRALVLSPQWRGDHRDGKSDAKRGNGNERGIPAPAKVLEQASPRESPDRRESRGAAPSPQADGSNGRSDSTRPGRPAATTAPDPPVAKDPPVALKVDGKAGFVYSPFHPDRRLVDVAGIPSGKRVKCPYTLKIFRVP